MKKLIFVLVLVSISMLSFAKDNAKGFGFAKEEISFEKNTISQTECLYSTGYLWTEVDSCVFGSLSVELDGNLNYYAYAETEASGSFAIGLVEVYLNHQFGFWSNSRSDGGKIVWVEATMSTPGFWTFHYVTYNGVRYGGAGVSI